MEKDRRATPYSITDEQETLAVDTFKNLVDHARVKLDIKERDKIPNIDGYIEIIDEFRSPIAKLEVQIKKLPDDERKIQCPVSLLNYSNITSLPVLLIGVDINQKKAYWVHVKESLFGSLGTSQKTKVIDFSSQNVLDGKNTKYITEWENIAGTYREKLRSTKWNASWDSLLQKSDRSLSIDGQDIRDTHIFLDELNRLLDREFSIIKRMIYPCAWKVGLAYYKYEDNSASFTLYPISLDKNDVQIKEIDAELREHLLSEGLEWRGYLRENPIKLRPKEYAVEIIESETLRILEERLLNYGVNAFLAREFIFAFVDRFSLQLGLSQKDRYSVDEIERAFFQYLPIWVDEAIRFMIRVQRNRVKTPEDCLFGKPYFDPNMLIVQIMSDERKQLDQVVRERIRRKDHGPKGLPLENNKFPFRVFEECLSFLKKEGFRDIDRVHSPKDYSRLQKLRGWWNLLSPEAVEINLRIFFDNLPKAYADLVSKNFPELAKDLPLFGEASRVIVIFNVKEHYTDQDVPGIKFFYLKGAKPENLKIEVYKEGDPRVLSEGLSADFLGKDFEIKGEKYRLISCSRGILDFIYDDLPMFNFIYKILDENLREYFADLKRSGNPIS